MIVKYKVRCKAELSSKALEQIFKVKTLAGSSKDSAKIKIQTAVIATSILKYPNLQSRFAWFLSKLSLCYGLISLRAVTYCNGWIVFLKSC